MVEIAYKDNHTRTIKNNSNQKENPKPKKSSKKNNTKSAQKKGYTDCFILKNVAEKIIKPADGFTFRTDISLTLELLNKQMFNKKCVLGLIEAVSLECKRLKEIQSKMIPFAQNTYEVAKDIKSKFDKHNGITAEQFKSLYNMVQGLARCY